MSVELHEFGCDHDSLLLYIETRLVEGDGTLDDRRMRSRRRSFPMPWKPEWGTRLKDGTTLPCHDDYDCLDDLVAERLVENVGTGANPVARLTDLGWTRAHRLRREIAERKSGKASGGAK